MTNQQSAGSSSVDGLGLEIELKLAVLNMQQRLDLLFIEAQNEKGLEILRELRALCDKVIHNKSVVEGL